MGLTIKVLPSILVLLLSILRPSLIGGQPAGVEEFAAVLEKLAPSSVVRGPFAPPPSEVLSGDGTEVPEKSAKGLPSISETPTDTNGERPGGRGAGGGPRGFVERRAGKGEESGRESMSWREGSPMGSMSWREGRPMGRERRTPSHCHLERGPVYVTRNWFTMIHIRPKSLPFYIDVRMFAQNNSTYSYLTRFPSETIKIGWRIGHWTAVYLEWRYVSGKGWAHHLTGKMKMTDYGPGYNLPHHTISIEAEKADWYIGDLNQACLEEEKPQTAEWNECMKDKNVCVKIKNALFAERNECVKDKNECVNDKSELFAERNECVKDKNECVNDKSELFAERNECVKDKNKCVKDKNECVNDKSELFAERNECVKDKNECVKDKNVCVKIKNALFAERNKCVKDKNECVKDKSELFAERNECVKDKNECVNDKNECVNDKNECVKDKNECVNDKSELFAERNECVKDKNECVNDKNECVKDKSELFAERNECVKDKNVCVKIKNALFAERNECVKDKNELFAECQTCLDEEKAQTEPTLFPVPGKLYNINIFINNIFYELIRSDK